jgi:hypothetical protein
MFNIKIAILYYAFLKSESKALKTNFENIKEQGVD